MLCFLLPYSAESQFPFDDQGLKFSRVIDWIDSYYVDSVDKEELVEHAIYEVLQELDPHSSYLTREEVIAMSEPLLGNFEGIGISFNILWDTVYVISALPGGPSEKAGLKPGDRILKVDGNNVAGIGISTDEVYDMLRGDKGSQVIISVKRKNIPVMIDFRITRDKIPINSIDASYKVTNDIGYIKINRFAQTTMDDYMEVMRDLRRENINNLIVDLTGNGGGYLEVAINLADQFIEADKLILYTEGLNSPRKEYLATREGNFEKGNLVILIDEGSASASEIVSGAIQDWDRGIIVGRRSFGKGLVQKPLLLPDQSMIRLTVARYYTPSGRLIQKPYDMGSDSYNLEIIKRFANGEFSNADSIHLIDSLKYYTLENMRIVYGGGGIMPDYFVSMDTSYYTDYYNLLVRKGTITKFALDYIDRHREELLARYPDFEHYKQYFRVDDSFHRKLVEFGWRDGIAENVKDYAVSKEHISRLIKAYIARDLWTGSEYYEIVNETDAKVQTAVMILKNWDKYEASLLNKKN